MGNCCSSPHLLSAMPSDLQDNWHSGNDNFDYPLYCTVQGVDVDNTFHRILMKTWKRTDLTVDAVHGVTYHNGTANQLRKLIHKGVPHLLVREVLLKILSFDDDQARNVYSEVVECFAGTEILKLNPTQEPLFGRTALSSCLLTEKGGFACKRVLFLLQNTVRGLEVCMLLPRVVQLLLWYFKEYEVYQMIVVLSVESGQREKCSRFTHHFPLGLQGRKQAQGVALFLIMEHVDRAHMGNLKIVVNDIIDNLLVGYVSPSLHSIVLCYFVCDGVAAVIKLVTALLVQNLFRTQFLLASAMGPAELIREFKAVSVSQVNIPELLIAAHKIRLTTDVPLDSEIVPEEDLVNYRQVFEGNSLILDSREKLWEFCSAVPLRFAGKRLGLVFSLFDSGNDSSLLVSVMKESKGPSVVLIEGKEQTIGIFIDKPLRDMKTEGSSGCRLLRLGNEPVFAVQVAGTVTRVRATKNKGLVVETQDESEEQIMKIDPSLGEVVTSSSRTYDSETVLANTAFAIYNLEAFELS